MQESPDKKQTEETMLRHFGEWGKIVKCKSYSSYYSIWADRTGNILYNRGIGFVCYEDEAHASFAKEAMANQSLDMDEILNVRYVDPNMGDSPTDK